MTDTPSNIPAHDQSCYKQYSEANIVGTKACPSYEAFSLSVETVIEGCPLPELSICKEDFKELERKVNVALDVCWMLWSRINPYLLFVIFFTRAKFLDDKIYTEKRQFFALTL